MISEQKIRDLITLGNENRNLDYKGAFSWANATNEEKCGIVKDVLAFANARDGGMILIGVNDKTGVIEGLTDEQFSSFDQTRFNDFVHKYVDPKHTSYVHRKVIDGKKLVAVEIPEFVDVPLLSRHSVQGASSPNQLILRQAGLYKRTDKATSELIDDADEMRELLNRALLRRQDELMFAMKQIIQPTSRIVAEKNDEPYAKEIEEGVRFFEQLWDGKLAKSPHWTLVIRPLLYQRERVKRLGDIQRNAQASAISLRGWTFPIAGRVSNSEWSNFGEGCQSAHDSPSFVSEAFRAYKSGLVMWQSELWEEHENKFQGGLGLSFASAIFSFTEWSLFAQRYFESFVQIDEVIRFEVTVTEVMNRPLISMGRGVHLSGQFRARVPIIHLQEDVTLADLRTDAPSVARRLIRKLFEMFNWNDPKEDMLKKWQDDLMSGKL